MASFDSVSDLRKRLDELEDEVRCIRSSQALGPEHQREGEAIQARARMLRQKASGAHGGGWEAAKHELHADWQALIDSMGRWVASVDRRYGTK